MRRTPATIWFASIVMVALGYLFIDRPLQEQVTNLDIEHDRTLAEIDRNGALAHDAAALAHRYALLHAATAAVDFSEDPNRLVATFVGEATFVAHTGHVRITGFDGRPLTRVAATPAVTPPSTTEAIAATTIELTVEGTYANLITSIRHLSHQRVPIRVEVASIERIPDLQHQSAPLLEARIRVDILHRTTANVTRASAS
jgi:hypothetical protein